MKRKTLLWLFHWVRRARWFCEGMGSVYGIPYAKD